MGSLCGHTEKAWILIEMQVLDTEFSPCYIENRKETAKKRE